jgi:SAM-dependent methyltransferase
MQPAASGRARSGYLFDNASRTERRRLEAIERSWDDGTVRVLERLGVRAGWRCLEVGAGAGSIARWLADRVRPHGSVLATDIDTRLLAQLHRPGLEVLRHDVVADELPTSEFDLVHARMVLQHLPERERALERMAAALRPGGWLLVEDSDWSTLLVSVPDSRDLAVLKHALRRVMSEAGFDPRCGLAHHVRLRALGLCDVGAEGRVRVVAGPGPVTDWYRLWVAGLQERLLASGLVNGREIEQAVAKLEDPSRTWMSQTLVATWGRAPTRAYREPKPNKQERNADHD